MAAAQVVLVGGGGGTAIHDISAAQPELVVVESDTKTKVKQPVILLEVIVPGLVFPVYTPIKGELIVEPAYTYKKSQLRSKLKLVKEKLSWSPEVPLQNVAVVF